MTPGKWDHNGTQFEKGIVVEFEPQAQARYAPAGKDSASNEKSGGNSFA